MVSQEHAFLARRMRHRSNPSRYLTRPLSLASWASSWICCLSRLSSLCVIMWTEVENNLSPVTASISLLLAHRKLRYLLLADVTGSCRPRPYFLNGIVLKVPTMGGRDFDFPKKIQGKKVSKRIFSTPANDYPVFFVTHCRNIHSDWIARTTAA